MIGADRSNAGRFTAPRQRESGYVDALTQAGLPLDPQYRADGQYTVAGGASGMAGLLSLPDPPTAVFGQSDEMAAGALQAVRRMGRHVPHDVSVVGFDDHELAQVLDLTTMAQPVTERGEIAAREIVRALAGGETVTRRDRVLVQTRLVVRTSTAPPTDKDFEYRSPSG